VKRAESTQNAKKMNRSAQTFAILLYEMQNAEVRHKQS
jgi:hypothetical protein